MKKVYFLPPASELNKSFNMIVDGIESNGIEIVNKDYNGRAFVKALSSFIAYKRGARVFHFNFLENYAANKNIKSIVLSTAILCWLKLLRKMGCRLVWTMNNKVPHECSTDDSFYKSFMKKYLKYMDATVVYCSESKDILIDEYNYNANKICSVAHGCFIPSKRLSKSVNSDNCLHLLSFGLISEYKNIPLLVKAFKKAKLEHTKLKIYGRCQTEYLKKQIEMECQNEKSIEFVEGFVSDERVDKIFEWADVVICPYEKDSMLNSGAVIMGLSQGKITVVPEFGYIKDIQEKKFIYSYDYTSQENHIYTLAELLVNLESEYLSNPQEFETIGMMAYVFSKDNLDWKDICKEIVEFY